MRWCNTLIFVTVTVDTATSILTGIQFSSGIVSKALLMARFNVSIPEGNQEKAGCRECLHTLMSDKIG